MPISIEEFKNKNEKDLTWTCSKKTIVLKKFFQDNPNKAFNFREICRLTNLHMGGSTWKYIDKLVKEGFVKKKGFYYAKE